MISKFFIERPVLSNVIAFLMILLGGVALATLPVAQYPPIAPPTIQVTASYPGASARTMVNKVALPIEEQVNGVEGMIYMQSACTNNGNYNLIVSFDIGTPPDVAEILVQNRVSAALAKLPESVQTQGVTTQTKSTAILQIITLTSPTGEFDSLFLNNYATLRLQNELLRVPGVGGVTVFGQGPYSMRIWLNPDLLEERSLTPNDVIQAISKQSTPVTAGSLGNPPTVGSTPFELTLNVNSDLSDVSEFEQIVVKADTENGGRITRLSDVARVELGSQSYNQFFLFDEKSAGGLAIYQLPGSNSIDTAKQVRAKMDELAKGFPPGLVYDIPFDTTIFVNESIKEVYKTLFEAGFLVLLVILIFLQDIRATLVPATTVPVTIIGAFALMAALGFTVNTLTLLAIVLAIGIVVDDAIVVVEAAAKHIEGGKTPKDAAIAAMQELFGPIIGVTLVLMSVFLPAAFLPGITGQLYRQFALVIAATALLSAVNAITLKPTQCAMWLTARKPDHKPNWFARGFNRVFASLENAYAGLIGKLVRHSGAVCVLAAGFIAIALWGFAKVPSAFIPVEDQGYAMVIVQLPNAASLERTEAAMSDLESRIQKLPGVAHTIAIGGISPLDNNASLANSGVIYVIYEPWAERGKKLGLLQMYEAINNEAQQIEEAHNLVTVPPAIPGLGLSGGFQMQVNLTDGSFDYERLQEAANAVVAAASERPEIRLAFTPFRAMVPQLEFDLNRAQARIYDVAVADAYSTLEVFAGSSYVSQFTKFGRNFYVFAQADQDFTGRPQEIANYTVRNADGKMVPLGSLADITSDFGPAIVSLYNVYPSAAVVGSANPGFSSGQAMDTMDAIAGSLLPEGFRTEWTAMSYQEKLAGSAVVVVFALSFVLVYFMLAGQYESWIIPIAVLLAVPVALSGTMGFLLVVGVANNVYVQIGMVLLIALSAKNAILVVERARELRNNGMELLAAATEAARSRFRPVLMTSITFILGVVPLILASGAGASARKSLGIAVASGMLASTCLAIVFVPSFFVVLQRLRERKA